MGVAKVTGLEMICRDVRSCASLQKSLSGMVGHATEQSSLAVHRPWRMCSQYGLVCGLHVPVADIGGYTQHRPGGTPQSVPRMRRPGRQKAKSSAARSNEYQFIAPAGPPGF